MRKLMALLLLLSGCALTVGSCAPKVPAGSAAAVSQSEIGAESGVLRAGTYEAEVGGKSFSIQITPQHKLRINMEEKTEGAEISETKGKVFTAEFPERGEKFVFRRLGEGKIEFLAEASSLKNRSPFWAENRIFVLLPEEPED